MGLVPAVEPGQVGPVSIYPGFLFSPAHLLACPCVSFRHLPAGFKFFTYRFDVCAMWLKIRRMDDLTPIYPKSGSYPDPASAVCGPGLVIAGAKRWQM